jgi:hypothetical protein
MERYLEESSQTKQKYSFEPKQREQSPPEVPPIIMAGGLATGNLQNMDKTN